MVAVTTIGAGTAHLPYLVPSHRPRRNLRRLARRLRAVLLVIAVVLVVRTVPGGSERAPLGASDPVRASAAPSVEAAAPAAQVAGPGVHVVQPGDTLWSIARALQPQGDVRPVVHRLAAQRRGAALQIGERIQLPR